MFGWGESSFLQNPKLRLQGVAQLAVYSSMAGVRYVNHREAWYKLPLHLEGRKQEEGEDPSACAHILYGALNAGMADLDDAQLLLVEPGFLWHQHWATYRLFRELPFLKELRKRLRWCDVPEQSEYGERHHLGGTDHACTS